jgi:hypothetical protein
MNLMRQIENDVKTVWDQIKNGQKLDLPYEDCPPNLLKGWTDNNPSLWEIDHPENYDLTRILFALCRKSTGWKKITYLIFNKSVIDNARLTIAQTNGNTGDIKIDNSKLHYEIKNITAKSLCTLIYYIIASKFEIGNYKEDDFKKTLLALYDNAPDKSLLEAQSKTNTMSVPPKSIIAITDTGNKDFLQKEEKPNKIYNSISSGTIDSSTGETSSNTATIIKKSL